MRLKWIAVIDERTCDTCRKLDGTISENPMIIVCENNDECRCMQVEVEVE